MNTAFEKLKQDNEILSFVENLWRNNFGQYGFEHLAIEIFQDINTFNKLEEFSQHINEVLSNKEFKKFGRAGRKSKQTNSFTYDLIKDYLNNVESILDFGCGKMAQLRRIARENHPNLKVIAGYDPKINPDYKDFDQRAEFFSNVEEFDERKFDLILCSFVLHHLEEKEINEVIEVMKNSLNPKGRILILEESFPEDFTKKLDDQSKGFLNKIGYSSSESLNLQFSNLSIQQRFDVIYINDVLINYKNLDYIPWSKTYKTMEEWRRVFDSNELEIQEQYYFGVIEKGRLKQGITGLFLLK